MANITGVNPPVLNDTDYVDKIYNSFVAIDNHDHTSGKGLSIGTTAITAGAITDALVNASAAIARTKIASGTASHVLINDGSGVMSSEAALAKVRGGSGIDNSSVTFPSSGVLVTETATETLTNKTLTSAILTTPTIDVENLTDQGSTPATPSAGTTKVYSKTDGKLYKLTSAGVEQQVGSGSGSGSGINYVTNPDFETGTTGYAAYADAAASTPVDGTGGSPTVTITRSASNPLRSTGSGLITKDAANRQGEGVSYDFSIDAADKAKVMAVSFDYAVGSGTFAGGTDSTTGDVNVYIYDVTNAVIIQPAGFKVLGSVSGQFYKHIATFQTASNSTSYRLIFHVASTSASAWTLKIDNVSVGPQIVQYGAPADDWVQYTPTFSGFGTTSNVSFWSRRVGDSLEMKGYFTAGTPTGVAAQITLGYKGVSGNVTVDSAKVNTNTKYEILGSSGLSSALAGIITPLYTFAGTAIGFGLQNGTSGGLTPQNGNAIIGVGAELSINIKVPIAGWSSTVLMSNDTDTRVVAAIITGDPASASSGNPIIVPTIGSDTHGGYNASTGRYTVPVSGFYKVFGALQSASSATTLTIYKNAASTQLAGNLDSNGEATFTGMVNCLAGDIIDIRPGGTVDATSMSLNIERLSGPSAIAASEAILARYTLSVDKAISTSQVLDADTKSFDTHGAVTTGSSWAFVAPAPGYYKFSFTGYTNSGTATNIVLYKNGSSTGQYLTAASNAQSTSGATIIKLVAGDSMALRATSSVNIIATASSGAQIMVERVGA